jgi:tRNA A-37 threonylcarbamoyl transferase component Bud32
MEPAASQAPAAGVPVDLSGRTLGDYHILRRLGHGGMGEVYLAEQLSLKRRVALKILRADLAADPTYLQRFRAEAEAVAQATHANIVQVYAIGEADGLHFMALEYVEGRNLRDVLLRRGVPEPALVVSVMRQVASALQRAAELGIVHRDIKPENILLTRKGDVKVADFGLARMKSDQPLNLTATGVTLGTPLYMSPEQVQGNAVDIRSDIYSFGVTCYHMLAGQPPYTGDNAFQVALQHVNDDPKPLADLRPDLPAKLCDIIARMMAKKPQDRYQTPRDLLVDLEQMRDEVSGFTGTEPVRAAILGLGGATGPMGVAAPSTVKSITLALPSWSRGAWLLALSLPLALLAGIGVAHAWIHFHPPTTKAADDNSSAGDVRGDTALADDAAMLAEADRKLEQYYRENFEKHRHPANVSELADTVDLACNLGVFYLERGKLSQADDFFKQLCADHAADAALERVLHLVGRVGQGMVLALHDDTDGAQNLFRVWLAAPFPDRPDRLDSILQRNPRFAASLGLALERLRENLGVAELPEPMEKYRKPKK